MCTRLSILFLAALLCSCIGSDERSGRLIVDDAGVLADISESLLVHLDKTRDDYDIEVVLATIDAPEGAETLREMTARLFTQWNVGREYGGRGLLLLLDNQNRAVRIEVGSALEHVYTDLFTGHIETKQLPAYYAGGQLEIGLAALVEEIELRAQLMSGDEADAAAIGRLDQKFLSGGGGADIALPERKAEAIVAGRTYPAGDTPDEAWQTLIQSWRDKNRNPDIGVYTPVTRLIYRAFTNLPDRRFDEDVRTYANKPYEIISDGRFAVVFFGKKKGWDNAPFLFCRGYDGWQFDMVHQRKIIRMGRAPAWGFERGEHPYVKLLSRCPYWMGQDMPIPAGEVYDVGRDAETTAMILDYERRLEEDGENFDILLNLGKLYTRTSMGQKRFKILKQADALRPDQPDVLKYLAISHVDAHYQYQRALELMNRYVRVKPDDPFGRFFSGYLQLMLDRPGQAVSSFEAGLAQDPDNLYGLCKLARAHMALGDEHHIDQARMILERVEKAAPDHIRGRWLRQALGE